MGRVGFDFIAIFLRNKTWIGREGTPSKVSNLNPEILISLTADKNMTQIL